jgi:hypothetical protein
MRFVEYSTRDHRRSNKWIGRFRPEVIARVTREGIPDGPKD